MSNLELSASILVLGYGLSTSTSPGENNSTKMNYNEVRYTIPTINTSIIYFFGSLGIEGKFFFDSGSGGSGTVSNSQYVADQNYYEFTTLGFYLGMVYKVDFLNR